MATRKDLKKIEKLFFGPEGETERKNWVTLIGRFMVAFGDIENITLLALERISSESLMRTARSLQLTKRIELLSEILGSKESISDEARANFIKSLAGAKKLSEMRNIIAHNPLLLTVHLDSPGELIAGHEIVSARNEDSRITAKRMQELVEQAEKTRTHLFDQYGQISGQLIQIQLMQHRKERRRLADRARRLRRREDAKFSH